MYCVRNYVLTDSGAFNLTKPPQDHMLQRYCCTVLSTLLTNFSPNILDEVGKNKFYFAACRRGSCRIHNGLVIGKCVGVGVVGVRVRVGLNTYQVVEIPWASHQASSTFQNITNRIKHTEPT